MAETVREQKEEERKHKSMPGSKRGMDKPSRGGRKGRKSKRMRSGRY